MGRKITSELNLEKELEELYKYEDKFIANLLNANLEDLIAKRSLEPYVFHCPICNRTHFAIDAIIVKRLMEITRKEHPEKDSLSVEITFRIGLICKECVNIMGGKLRNTLI